MNKVMLIGRFSKDPDVRCTQGGNAMAVARFSLAVQRRFKRENEPDCDFINCVAFGKQAEFIEKYMHKGMRIAIEGRWQTGSYTNRDGQKVYTNDCVIESCEFVEGKNANTQQPTQQTDPDGFINIPEGLDSELPFN